jgi:hypothetical protein
MKKIGAFFTIIAIFTILSVSLSLAENHTSNEITEDNSNSGNSDADKIENGYLCLEDKVNDCSSLSNQEIALTILATPEDTTFNSCVSELQGRMDDNNWGNVRDTALSILALDHAGIDTTLSEEWLLLQTHIPTDLIWYLEQDSNGLTSCNIGYDSDSYSITIDDDKKINQNAGSCLTRAQSNFWLKISPECYNKEFRVECDEDFITALLYKNKNSPTIFVLEGTQSSPALGNTLTSIFSKCFGDSTCNYEASAWATLALLRKGYNVEEYLPYLVALSETNKQYLPNSFIYMVTNYQDYASSLVEERKLGNYWLAENSPYGKFYDTSLALLSIGSSSGSQIQESKDWLLFTQDNSGCWQNSVRDTAIVLWALNQKPGRSSSGDSGSSSVTTCGEANFFCIPSSECESADERDNYFCSSLSTTCCAKQNLKTCSEYAGSTCDSNEVCIGNERNSLDTSYCCTGYCEEAPTETECESNFYTCKESCSDSQESIGFTCNSGDICCRTKTDSSSGASNWWIWVLVLLILGVIGAIMWVKREQVKLFFFKMKSKFKKDDGDGKGSKTMHIGGPGFSPRRPGAPMRRMPSRPPITSQGQNIHQSQPKVKTTMGQPRRIIPRQTPKKGDKDLANTFKKLKEMSK